MLPLRHLTKRVEFQCRGLVQVHDVMRVDAEDEVGAEVVDLLAALEECLGGVEAPNQWQASRPIRRGPERDLVALSAGEHRKVAA